MENNEQNEAMKDLGLVVATKEEEFWIKAKEETDKICEQLERQLKFNKAVQEMCQKNATR